MSDEREESAPHSGDDGRAGSGRATLTVCPDGPLLVRGEVDLVGEDGVIIPRERQTVALCRCGRSSIRPMCDGSHKLRRGRQRPSRTDAPERGASAGPSSSAATRDGGGEAPAAQT